MVDTVLYFEGERGHQFRILRAVKNRFGASDEIGVFEMSGRGLEEVKTLCPIPNRSRKHRTRCRRICRDRRDAARVGRISGAGRAQPLSQPRRTVVGWDSGRLSMILAVLEARAGIAFSGLDVYLNVAGGMRVNEPAADLAVAAPCCRRAKTRHWRKIVWFLGNSACQERFVRSHRQKIG